MFYSIFTDKNLERVKATFIIGSDTLPKSVLNEIVSRINYRYGGCTISTGKGCWSEEGDTYAESYGNVATEKATRIEVVMVAPDFDEEYLQKCFLPALGHANWVHSEYQVITCNHFSLEKLHETTHPLDDDLYDYDNDLNYTDKEAYVECRNCATWLPEGTPGDQCFDCRVNEAQKQGR